MSGKKTPRQPTMKRSMHVPDQRTSKQQRDNMRGFRKKFQRASRGGGATVVTAILGDEVKTVHVTLATGSRAPTEAAWRRFCTVFPGLPSSVFGSQSKAMGHGTTFDGRPECSVDMQPADSTKTRGIPSLVAWSLMQLSASLRCTSTLTHSRSAPA